MFSTIIKNKFNKFNITTLFNLLMNIKSNKISLGRWSNENLNKTNLKVDYANEDHCGVCTSFIKK